MDFAYLVSLLLLGSIAFALVREMKKASPRPAGLRGHIRARGWGLALLPIALMSAVMTGHVHALAVAELRRIERDLHDGAQARLVAVGMSLQAAERLFASNPEPAPPRGSARCSA